MSDDAYDFDDPKRDGWADDLEDRADLHRHDEQHDLGVCGKPDPS